MHRRQFFEDAMAEIRRLEALPATLEDWFGKPATKSPPEQRTSLAVAAKLAVWYPKQELHQGEVARWITEGDSMHRPDLRPEARPYAPIRQNEAAPQIFEWRECERGIVPGGAHSIV